VSNPDEADFEAYVAARRSALLRTAYLLTGDLHDAEDLVQVALAKTLPHWRRVADRPEPYVRRVMSRESISRWRARRWREHTTSTVPDLALIESGPSTESRLDLLRALAALPPRQRAVIVLRYYEDLTETETARLLGIAVGTVKSQTRDALVTLRKLLPEASELLR
jgi:RNA polymerase sigma-70 factor (sigma-E family)